MDLAPEHLPAPGGPAFPIPCTVCGSMIEQGARYTKVEVFNPPGEAWLCEACTQETRAFFQGMQERKRPLEVPGPQPTPHG